MIDFDHKNGAERDRIVMKVPLHIVHARRQRLALWMQQHGHVSLQEICREFEISEATARRDLAALEAGNQIVRTYGGALAEYNHRFASFRERLAVSAQAKALIAKRARAMIAPDSTIFIDAGTTAYAIAQELQRAPVQTFKPLEVVTNSLPVADILANTPGLRLHLLGGELLPRQSVLAGEAAIHSLQLHQIDLAFISAEGFNRAGAWNSQKDVVAFQQALMRRSIKTVMCVDACKLGRTAPVFLCGWKSITTIITDATAPSLLAEKIPASKTRPLPARQTPA